MSLEIQNLESKIAEAARAYYLGRAIMPDSHFDSLVEKLRSLAPESKVLSTIGWGGGKYLGRFKANHFSSSIIGSLDKIQEGDPWGNRDICTPKLDGGSVVVTYKNGVPIAAITRGDGRVGQGVLSKVSGCIPERISYNGLVSVRGEALITNEGFKELHDRGIPNPRNYVSGILNRDQFNDPDLRFVSFIAYSIVCSDPDFPVALEKLKFLEWLGDEGFQVAPVNYIQNDFSLASNFYHNIQSKFPIDGLVFTNNTIHPIEDGDLISYKEDSIAYKFYGEQAETVVTNILWDTGNSGRINPVVEFNPVSLEGSTISRASGYNVKFIRELQLAPGVSIIVRKANGIIPEIVDSSPISEASVSLPTTCPACGAKLSDDGVFLSCTNPACQAKSSAAIYRFLSIAEIPFGLSNATIDKFLVNFSSLEDFLVKIQDTKAISSWIATYFGNDSHFGKLLRQLMTNVYNKLASGIKIWEFWYILNLTNLGEANAKKIVETPDQVLMSGNISSNIPRNAKEAILSNLPYIRKIASLTPECQENTPASGSGSDLIKFTYTGKTDKFKTRKEFFNFFKDKAVEVPIAKADYLICNEPSSSSKSQYAKSHGIKIISEAEAISLMG